MSKNKFILDQQEPSSEEIKSKADFPGLKGRFIEGKGVQRFKKWVAAAVAAGIVVLVSLFVLYPSDEEVANRNDIEAQDAVGVNEQLVTLPKVPHEIFRINSNEETDVFTSNGTILHIPENAFVNSTAEITNGEVELVYTEFDDPVSIFLSGISMQYDSAGTKYGFQTGGMFSLEAKQNSEVLTLADGKEIAVYHPTELATEDLNVYTKSNAKDNWKYEMRSQVMSFGEACEELTITFDHTDKELAAEVSAKSKKRNTLQQNLQNLQLDEIVEPHRLDNENYTFDLDIDPVEFPELKSFQTLKFEVVDPSFRYSMFHVTYDDILLKKAEDGSYQVHLYKESEKTILNVFPVLSETEMTELEKEYQKKLQSRLKKEAEMQGEVYMLEEWLEERREILNKELEISSSRRLINDMRNVLLEDRPVRKFMLSDLSIVNHDAPYSVPKDCYEIQASFKQGEEDVQLSNITLVNLQKNAYLDYFEKDFSAFKYERTKKHIGLTTLRDGSFAVVVPAEFKNADKNAVAISYQVITTNPNQEYSGLKEEVYNLLDL